MLVLCCRWFVVDVGLVQTGHGALPAHLTQVLRVTNVGRPVPWPVLLMATVDPTVGRWAPLLWLVVVAAGVLAATRYRPFRRVEVVGSSMVPALLP